MMGLIVNEESTGSEDDARYSIADSLRDSKDETHCVIGWRVYLEATAATQFEEE